MPKKIIVLLSLITALVPLAASQTRSVVRDFSKEFEGFDGAFVLYNRQDSTMIRHRPDLCARRFSPASTFKILNSLIGLETGVIPDRDYVIRWDGVKRSSPAWNRDHSLQSAIQYSVVWYYQELARRVGAKRMQEYVDKAGYGNRDISGGIDRFWLGSSLKISPEEQVEFLEKLYDGTLPFSPRSLRIVREILPHETNDAAVIHGKTGLTRQNVDSSGSWLGWYVGYIERGSTVCFFATFLISHDPSPDRLFAERESITKTILQELHLY